MLDKRFTEIKNAFQIPAITLLICLLTTQFSLADGQKPEYSGTVIGTDARIVSLAPAATEMLFYIGAGPQVVGRTNACDFPPEALELPHVGSLFPPNLEAILRLKPDMVVMASGSDALRKDLKKWDVFIHTYQPNSLRDIARQMRVLGHLTSRNQTTETLALQFESTLDRLRVKPSASSPRVYWQIWSQPLMTAGGPSFVNDLIQWAGGQNVFGQLKEPWPKVTSEAVVRTAPTIVFSTENLTEQINTKPWLKLLNLQPDKIIHIKTPDLVHRPTPRVLEGLEWLIKALGNQP